MSETIKRLVLLCAVALLLPLLSQTPCAGEFNAALNDEELQAQYDWAVFLNIQDMDHYLNYAGSKLHPLSKVRVYWNTYSRSSNQAVAAKPAQLLEDLWYYKGKPISLRRHQQLRLAPKSDGIIIVGEYDGTPEHSFAFAHAIASLVADLQCRQVSPGVLMLPKERYKAITDDLGHYNFSNEIRTIDGPQLSLHIRSYPQQRDEYFFLEQHR